MKKKKLNELNRISAEDYKSAHKISVIVVLDNIRSLNNIGSVFRTCDAFRVEGIYLCGITAQPPHRDITKTALGATESVMWSYYKDSVIACKKLKEKGFELIAIEQAEESRNLVQMDWIEGDKHALIFGHEVNGVRDEVMSIVDACVEIPQFGTKAFI